MSHVEIKNVLEFFIPSGYLLNDNVKNDYRSNMGKMKWLTDQVNMAVDNAKEGYTENPKLLCRVRLPEELNIDPNNFGLIINHIKINKTFDLANYERTMKPPIDVLTSRGYWSDDNCSCCNPIIFVGGNAQEGIKDPFNILSPKFKNEESIIEYFSNIPEYWLTKTKYKKITDYDLFQLFVINFQ